MFVNAEGDLGQPSVYTGLALDSLFYFFSKSKSDVQRNECEKTTLECTMGCIGRVLFNWNVLILRECFFLFFISEYSKKGK